MKIIKKLDNEEIFPYIACVPENITGKPAMILQLHGAGERGCGNEDLEMVCRHGFRKIVNDENLKNCILVMPQCPKNTFWVAKIESLRAFIDKMIEKFYVDTDRIYLCGLSMGGFGTWYTATAYPDLFACIAPCCGGGMPWNAGVLKMPIWTFHGLADTVVSPNQTIEMIEALKKADADLRYDLYEGVGHNSWDIAFSEKTLAWILSNKKEAK